jgi:glutathione S-transferase
MILYYHPLSSYCWKALIALYENDVPFERHMMEDPGVAEAWLTLWPLGKFPVLRDEARDRTLAETSIIIELSGPALPRRLPRDPA